jgi:hypothetical protein
MTAIFDPNYFDADSLGDLADRETRKVARSTRSQDLLCRLVREIDYAEAYRVIRAFKHGGDGELPSIDSVIVWVLDLMRLRNALIAGDSEETIREIIEQCGKPIAEDDSPMDESNEALEYLEHSTELQAVWDILSGVPEADRKAGPYPLDVDRGRVAEKAAALVESMNSMADRLGAERQESELPKGWQRIETSERPAGWSARFKRVCWVLAGSGIGVDLVVGPDGVRCDCIEASQQVSLEALAAILTIESNRGLA